MTASREVDQGGLEAVSGVDRVASLTGVRAVAALLAKHGFAGPARR